MQWHLFCHKKEPEFISFSFSYSMLLVKFKNQHVEQGKLTTVKSNCCEQHQDLSSFRAHNSRVGTYFSQISELVIFFPGILLMSVFVGCLF